MESQSIREGLRSRPSVNYREKEVPKRTSRLKRQRRDLSPEAYNGTIYWPGGRPPRSRSPPSEPPLYRVTILERQGEHVKVHYVGYGHENDEWRLVEDVVDLPRQRSGNDAAVTANDSDESDCEDLSKIEFKPHCLYNELRGRIKRSLMSSRRRDPVCKIELGFDAIYFEGMAKRGTLISKGKHTKCRIYTVTKFSKLEDILGENWYIRGLNLAGDFCYVQPGTVQFYLSKRKVEPDYQLRDDGTLTQFWCGDGYQLVFKFVRGDGTQSQWNRVRQQCS